jgi:hypothetical protein
MNYTIDFIPNHEGATRGTLCIRDDWPMTDRPVILRLWSRISSNARLSEVETWIGQPVQRVGPGLYEWYGGMRPLRFRLEHGGETIAFKTQEIEVPPPKTRVETRWAYGGYWEKYLKSKGWVKA